MKLKEYMNYRKAGDEITCWDNDIDSEFYFYKKNKNEKSDPDFASVAKLEEYLAERLEIKEIADDGITVGLYELLDDPFILDYAKKQLYESWKYGDDDELKMLIFDDMLLNLAHGYEDFSASMVQCFDLLDKERSQIKVFKIPVVYEVWGTINVIGKTIEDAIRYAENNLEILPLPDEPNYIDGTYKIDYEGISLHNELTDQEFASLNKLHEEPYIPINEKVENISLTDFLRQLDFSYEISYPGDTEEHSHRMKLIEDGEMDEENLVSPMLKLIDDQGANLGNIEKERFCIDEQLTENLVTRLDTYVHDYVEEDFISALNSRIDDDLSNWTLNMLVDKAIEQGIGNDEVSYELARCFLKPQLINISELDDKLSKNLNVLIEAAECEHKNVEKSIVLKERNEEKSI